MSSRTVRQAVGPALISLLLLAALPACAAESHSEAAPPARSASTSPEERFLHQLRSVRSDYDPAASVADLAKQSDAVVLGRLKEVREGKVRGSSRADPDRAEYVLYVFEILEQRKGSLAGNDVYVESMKAGFEPAAELDAAAPKGAEAVLFLRTPTTPRGNVLPPPVLPPVGLPTFAFTTPQGFLMRVNGRVVAPLAGPVEPLFPQGDPDRKDLKSWLPAL